MIITQLPGYFEEVIRRLGRADWLVHNFKIKDSTDIYNPANYLQNVMLEGMKYHASLDLNVLQYTVSCLKKRKQTEFSRNACAMLLFCRAAEIDLEPSLALYERINHGKGSVEDALDDLSILRALDNADPDLLAEYMLGNPSALRDIEPASIDRAAIREQLTRYRRLTHWDSLYVLVLGVTAFYYDLTIPPTKRLEKYLDWVVREFRLSLPCLAYAVRLFGTSPMKNMMKYNPGDTALQRRAALSNMTWDLFLIDHYFKTWTAPDKHWEEILFTHDTVVRSLLRVAIRTQYEEDISPLLALVHPEAAGRCRELLEERDSRSDRVFGTEAWSPQYREDLIAKLEDTLAL